MRRVNRREDRRKKEMKRGREVRVRKKAAERRKEER